MGCTSSASPPARASVRDVRIAEDREVRLRQMGAQRRQHRQCQDEIADGAAPDDEQSARLLSHVCHAGPRRFWERGCVRSTSRSTIELSTLLRLVLPDTAALLWLAALLLCGFALKTACTLQSGRPGVTPPPGWR